MDAEKKARISESLKNAFSFECEGLDPPISWSDAVGTSRVKDWGNGHASLFKIGILDKELNNENNVKQLYISVDYGKKIHGGISIGEETNLSNPIDFDNSKEFSFDVESHVFYQNKKTISSEQLFTILEQRHIKPTKKFTGFFLRAYLWLWRICLPNLIKLLDRFLLFLLWLVSGETIKRDILGRLLDGIRTERAQDRISIPNQFRKEKVEFNDGDTIDFFGYKARRWSVVFYCTLHLFLLTLFVNYSVHSVLIESIFENNFTTLCYVVTSFSFTEALIPEALKFLIRKTVELYGLVAFRRLGLWGL